MTSPIARLLAAAGSSEPAGLAPDPRGGAEPRGLASESGSLVSPELEDDDDDDDDEDEPAVGGG